MKRNLSMLMAVFFVMTLVLSACGGGGDKKGAASTAPTAAPSSSATTEPSPSPSGDGGIDTSKEVKLKMIFVGPKPVDYDQVFAELNKKLKEKINATVEGEFLDWSDWSQKYPLKLAANEDFDLIYSANWAGYGDQALKGGFLELTEDLLKTYAPMTWKNLPEVAWGQAKVDGKLYMIPQNNSESVEKVIMYREDLRKKYNLPAIDSPEAYANYLKAVSENEKGINPFTPETGDWKLHNLDRVLLKQANDWNMLDFDLPLGFKMTDEKGQIFNVYQTQEFKDLLVYYKDLADHNAWSKNVLNSKNDHQQDFVEGKTASITHNLGTLETKMAEMRRNNSPYEVAVADITPNSKKSQAISTQNGTSIHSTSKNVERALMFVDLMQNDKELHDLIMYGLPGVHYEPVGDNLFKATDKGVNFTNFSNWCFNNSALNRKDQSLPEETSALGKSWDAKVYHYALETFVFNNASVKTEVANVSNVMLRYAIPLEYGAIKDVDKGLEDLNKQMKAAGIDKIQEEMQRQIDEFLAKQ